MGYEGSFVGDPGAGPRCLKESQVSCCEEGLAVLTDSRDSFPGAARAVPRGWSWCAALGA